MPCSIERMAFESSSGQWVGGHLKAARREGRLQCRLEMPPWCRCGLAHDGDADGAAEAGSPTPSGGERADQPLVTLVPLAGTGRPRADRGAQAAALGPCRPRPCPPPRTAPLAPAGVGCPHERSRRGRHRSSQRLPPAADRFRGQRGRGRAQGPHAPRPRCGSGRRPPRR